MLASSPVGSWSPEVSSLESKGAGAGLLLGSHIQDGPDGVGFISSHCAQEETPGLFKTVVQGQPALVLGWHPEDQVWLLR